jgi:hypothetical protein
VGQLAVNTAVRPTTSFGTQSFTSVMAHYVSINNPAEGSASIDDCKHLGLGMMVFVRETEFRDPKHPRRIGARYDGVNVGPNTAEFKELTQLNQYLAKHSHDYDSADAVLAEWRLMGVIKNEAAPTTAAYGNAAVSRVINLVVSHRVSMLNYWARSRIVQTQKLYLVVRKNGEGKWHVTPWTSPNFDYPPLKEVMYDGGKALGAVVYVGKSSDQAWAQHGGHSNTPTDVSQSLVKRGMMSTIEVYIGV